MPLPIPREIQMDDKTYRRLFLSCQCGKRFRSYAAEAFHRHNFPIMCKVKRKKIAKQRKKIIQV